SELMTNATIGGRDIAVLYGEAGRDGEAVLRDWGPPAVTSAGGDVKTTWDAASGDLRLNYKHAGLIRVLVGGPRPLLLLIGDKTTAGTFWRQGDTIVRGTHLLRGATVSGDTLALTGDNADGTAIEVFATAPN